MKKIFVKYQTYLILLIILILTHFIQLTTKESNSINNPDLVVQAEVGLIAWGKLPNCTIWLNSSRFSVSDCSAWSSSGKLTIIGNRQSSSAADNLSQKVLIKKVIYSSGDIRDSLKNRLVNFLNFTSFRLIQKRTVIFSYLEEKDRSLLLALLFGQSNSGLTLQLHHYFTQSGLQNLISVSSYTFSLTIEFFLIAGKHLSEKRKYIELTMFLVISYFVILVGYPLALQRVVYGFFIDYLGQRVFHRPISPLYRLVLSSLALLVVNPYAFFDVGLEFSVLAAIGIYLFSKPPKQVFMLCALIPAKWRKRVAQLLWLPCSAQIFTWPLIFYYFGEMSLMSPLSNIAVLWVLPSILTLGIGYWLIGQIYLPTVYSLIPFLSSVLAIFKAELRFLSSFGFLLTFQPTVREIGFGYCLISFFTFVIFFNHKRHLTQSIYLSLTG